MTAKGTRLVWVEIRGFRAFGVEPRKLSLDATLVIAHAGNSQGKSSLAEALEFLIAGRSSRRDLLGGAKAEYDDSLRNAHLPEGDDDVYVAAGVRTSDGAVHVIRRELVADFGHGAECASRLVVDGVPADDLASVGLPNLDPPVRAPVLLQHTLRHVLSTEPKQRVGYFKALLSLTDLDLLLERVAAVRSQLGREAPGALLTAAASLPPTASADPAAGIRALAEGALDAEEIARAVDTALIAAGGTYLDATPTSRSELEAALVAAIADQREDSFPFGAFQTTSVGVSPIGPDLATYQAALQEADREAVRLAPLYEAALAVEGLLEVDRPVDCPLCETPSALTPARIRVVRDLLVRTATVNDAATVGLGAIQQARGELGVLLPALSNAAPAAAAWSAGQILAAATRLGDLGVDDKLLTPAHATAMTLLAANQTVQRAIPAATDALESAQRAIKSRTAIPAKLVSAYSALNAATQELERARERHDEALSPLRDAVDAAVRHRVAGTGPAQLLHLTSNIGQLVDDLAAEAGRRRTVQRLQAAEQVIRKAAALVLDARFQQMSDAIDAWWVSIRPEELVGFGGVRRRAGGARFVNLDATLRSAPSGDPVIRDALGVYSDSQLNALGLSIFLARSELMGSSVLVLDDPIPGSDAEHRLTFVQNTLGTLLDSGTQVVITTFDGKLADWTQANHAHRGLISYELTLADPTAGTYPTQTSDMFSRLLLEAEDNLNAPTPRGRRAACGSYRAAAERLAKQIIATGRTHDGQPCAVADVDAEAPTLRDLVPLVSGYSLDNAEKGQWRTFAKVLNPGNHDDEVPDSTTLKQIRGNLRKISKSHRDHWSTGLLV